MTDELLDAIKRARETSEKHKQVKEKIQANRRLNEKIVKHKVAETVYILAFLWLCFIIVGVLFVTLLSAFFLWSVT